MERSQLKYVVEVAKWQNITRASEALHISQPSLSNQILNLERELGVSLFERVRKRVYLTEAGESFVYQATKILNDMEHLKQSMAEYAQRRAGRICVGALPVMVPLGIPDALTAFAKQYPLLQVDLTEEGSFALIHKIKTNELDAAFVNLLSHDSEDDIYQIKLTESRFVAALNSAHPLAQRTELTLTDLKEQPLIITSESFNMQRMILAELDHENIPYRIAASCNQIESCFRLVDKGFGISFCSEEASEYYFYKNVQYIPIQGIPSRALYLIYKKDPAYYPALQTFVSFVREWYQ